MQTHPQELKDIIKAEALALGFVDCRVASAEAAVHYDKYLLWLEQGRHAEMGWMARPDAIEKRGDLNLLLPGCKTVICVALPYAPNPARPRAESPVGTIAAYATRPDYHQEITTRLGALAERIKSVTQEDVSCQICVDSAHLLEKDYAQASGLGWIGKNSCLTNPGQGSWLLLGELLLTIELPPDVPISDSECIDCLRCQMACPTHALLPDRSVDARRCLSYLTIEHRGPIPEEFRPLLGTRVFGCDTCQTACPQTSKQPMNSWAEPHISPHPSLLEELALDEAAFREKYAGSPVLRARHQGYRRNVVIALGNSRAPEVLPNLQAALENEQDPIIKDALSWSIRKLTQL